MSLILYLKTPVILEEKHRSILLCKLKSCSYSAKKKKKKKVVFGMFYGSSKHALTNEHFIISKYFVTQIFLTPCFVVSLVLVNFFTFSLLPSMEGESTIFDSHEADDEDKFLIIFWGIISSTPVPVFKFNYKL